MCLVVAMVIGHANSKEKPTKPADTRMVYDGWTVTSDMAGNIGSLSMYMITDPQGQKFLVVKTASGVAMTPYNPLSTETPVEKK